MKRLGLTPIALRVNGHPVSVPVAAGTTLLGLLRDHCGLTGAKLGCGVGECGACTVLVDEVPTPGCLVLAAELDGTSVTTIEFTGDPRIERLKESFQAEAGLQCGFCTPGMIMTASRLAPTASAAAIRAELAGNLCRCTGYTKIIRAVGRAGRKGGPGGRR
jgi:carbon-monoxide dehydrogenase small subunit